MNHARKKARSRKLKNDVVYLSARFGVAVAQVLPRRIGLSLFGGLGRLAFIYPDTQRTRTIDHLRSVFGDIWDERRIRRVAAGVYDHLGRTIFDTVKVPLLPATALERIVVADDFGAFDAAYRRGNGVIAFTAHLGCFEMLLHFFEHKGYASFAVGAPLYDPRLDRLITRMRTRSRAGYVHRSGSARRIIAELRAGRVFGVLVDQDTMVEGVFAPFLGRLAYTPSGPVKIAMKYGIPSFVVTTVRQPDGRHRVSISEELRFVATDDPVRDLVRNVTLVNDHISAAIRRNPTQWVWMHRRWRHVPGQPGFEGVPTSERYETNA